MDAETITLRDGDVYRWRYKEPSDRDGEWGRYHCCSRIAVFKDGRLWDTYWSSGSDNRSFGPPDWPKLELTLLGNFADFETATDDLSFYAEADVMNLSHANSSRGNLYIRKGATRCAEAMLSAARERLRRAEYEQQGAEDRAEKLRSAITKIEAGDTSVYI